MSKMIGWMIIMVLMMACAALAGDDALPIMVPLEGKELDADHAAPLSREAGVIRQGQVLLATDFFFPADVRGERRAALRPFRGRKLGLTIFADRQFTLVLDGETRRDDVLSVTGRLKDHELSTFSLTVGPETYVLHLQDMESGTLYRVVGETDSGVGMAVTQDLTVPPGFTYSEPLVPPAGGGQ